ncbi:MAG: nucleotide exchange factor GrpE [Anaerolineales bacterium]|nr:nucleotide exchange factor GrpE [Anaerolineales bacterium]
MSEQEQEKIQAENHGETIIDIETEIDQEAAPEAEEEPSLEEQLEKANEQAAEYLDGWQRARAELANFRRRVEAQRSEMAIMSNANLLEKLLPLLDDLQLALTNDPQAGGKQDDEQETNRAWQEWRDGVALITQKFANILNGVGVVPIETDGQDFDPNVHEAVSYEEHPEKESGQIIAQVRTGYKLGDRVLRAAMVRVAR